MISILTISFRAVPVKAKKVAGSRRVPPSVVPLKLDKASYSPNILFSRAIKRKPECVHVPISLLYSELIWFLFIYCRVVLPRTRASRHRALAPQSASSDIEIIEDTKPTNDEGYESAAPSDEGNIESAFEEEDNGKPMELDPWHVSSNNVDENGHLKALINNEVSSSGEDEDDGMEVDESGEEEQEVEGQEESNNADGHQESRCVVFYCGFIGD